MKFNKYIFLFFLFIAVSLHAQENAQTNVKDPVNVKDIDEGTISDQFDYIINKSNSYTDPNRNRSYKVVRKEWLNRLKKATDDSLAVLETELNSTVNLVKTKDAEITNLTISLDESNSTITQLNKEKDGIKLIGIIISKPLYNTILWSTIGGLLVFLIIYIVRFNRSNSITKDSQEKFDELENEFDNFRQRSLEREQQLRRKLQDEINKQRKEK